MTIQTIIQLTDAVARDPQVRLDTPASINLCAGEHLAITGPNGAGKSLLVEMLTGGYPLKTGQLVYDFSPSSTNTAYDNLKYITFRDTYGAADTDYYYQQRWNSDELDVIPTVRSMLGKVKDTVYCDKLFALFGIRSLIDKPIILLSSGELRKMQLIKALLSIPRVLVIDNPFIGLDSGSRELLCTLLEDLVSLDHLQMILVLSIPAEIPGFITHVLPVEQKRVGEKVARETYFSTSIPAIDTAFIHERCQRVAALPETEVLEQAEVVRLNKVSIRYGERTILHALDWTVHCSEHWALSGVNGSGKSTLLSLVCADNPQSYACDIHLFGRKRGSGESIWEIKKRIGYVSPEMHRAYHENIPAVEIVASGLHDSIGLYKRPRPEDMDRCIWWMDIFGIAALKDRPFLQFSSGEQRLTLLARAFVKDPELLILDEPLHGLDPDNRLLVRRVIDAFCLRKSKTLIMVTHYEEDLPDCIDHSIQLTRQQV